MAIMICSCCRLAIESIEDIGQSLSSCLPGRLGSEIVGGGRKVTQEQLQGSSVERLSEDIMNSQEAGCVICDRIKQHLTGPDERTPVPLRYVLRDFEGGVKASIGVNRWTEQRQPFADHESRRAFSVDFHLLPGQADTDDAANAAECQSRLDRMQRYVHWRMQKCRSTHPSCRPTNWWHAETRSRIYDAGMDEAEEMWQPTRLLEIVGAEFDDTMSIRIVTAGDQYRGPYVDLSYSWGGWSSHKLEESTLGRYSNGITYRDLPRTFQDAVRVTRWIGCTYLWIDSLCIIQDSAEDWANESALMDKVYQSAELTISASAALNNEGGLFLDTQKVLSNTVHQLSLFKTPAATYRIIDCTLWSESMGTSPLRRRAWTLQERMLSKRLLHFGRSQIFFQCAVGLECESYPGRTAYSTNVTLSTRLERHVCSMDLHADREDLHADHQCAIHIRIATKVGYGLNEFAQMWWNMVRVYSTCNLTFEPDKLVAIGGLAKWLHIWHGDRYFAGLWEKSLLTDLCWHVPDYQSPRRPSTFVAPTWSWASVVARVDFHAHPFQVLGVNNQSDLYAQVVDVKLEKATLTSFGRITGGALSIASQPRRISIRKVRAIVENVTYHELESNGRKVSPPDARLPTHVWLDLTLGRGWHDLTLLPIWSESIAMYGILLSKQGADETYSRVGQIVLSNAAWQQLDLGLRTLREAACGEYITPRIADEGTFDGRWYVRDRGFETLRIL